MDSRSEASSLPGVRPNTRNTLLRGTRGEARRGERGGEEEKEEVIKRGGEGDVGAEWYVDTCMRCKEGGFLM